MRYWILSLLALLLCSFPLRGEAENATPLTALARLPIKEITVFKDGNTFVLHQGEMPTDSEGNVEMDYLPTPVLGTFWPYSADPRVGFCPSLLFSYARFPLEEKRRMPRP